MTITEFRIVGRNSAEVPFVATQEEAETRLATFDRYLQYGTVHVLQSREISAWS